MLKRIVLSLVVGALMGLPHSAWADFAAGVDAYDNGEYTKAFEEWLPLAKAGDPAAQRNIGHLYRKGLGTRQDLPLAAEWYGRAADLGFARAQANLGSLYLRGEGVDQNYMEAALWFDRAARQGHAIAQYNLGLMYELGLGVVQDDEKAFAWFYQAARAGHNKAADKLAQLVKASPGPGEPSDELPPSDFPPSDIAEKSPKETPKEAPTVAAAPAAQPAPPAQPATTSQAAAPEPAEPASTTVVAVEPERPGMGKTESETAPAAPETAQPSPGGTPEAAPAPAQVETALVTPPTQTTAPREVPEPSRPSAKPPAAQPAAPSTSQGEVAETPAAPPVEEEESALRTALRYFFNYQGVERTPSRPSEPAPPPATLKVKDDRAPNEPPAEEAVGEQSERQKSSDASPVVAGDESPEATRAARTEDARDATFSAGDWIKRAGEQTSGVEKPKAERSDKDAAISPQAPVSDESPAPAPNPPASGKVATAAVSASSGPVRSEAAPRSEPAAAQVPGRVAARPASSETGSASQMAAKLGRALGFSPSAKPEGAPEFDRAKFAEGQVLYDAGSYKAALDAWLPIAESGDPETQYQVGKMYIGGMGTDRDPSRAYMWWSLATNQNHAKAADSLGTLVGDLTQAQMASAEFLVESHQERR